MASTSDALQSFVLLGLVNGFFGKWNVGSFQLVLNIFAYICVTHARISSSLSSKDWSVGSVPRGFWLQDGVSSPWYFRSFNIWKGYFWRSVLPEVLLTQRLSGKNPVETLGLVYPRYDKLCNHPAESDCSKPYKYQCTYALVPPRGRSCEASVPWERFVQSIPSLS